MIKSKETKQKTIQTNNGRHNTTKKHEHHFKGGERWSSWRVSSSCSTSNTHPVTTLGGEKSGDKSWMRKERDCDYDKRGHLW
jgi:hypothetical protein